MNRIAAGAIISLAAIMLGLFAIDRYLANLEKTELQKEAAGLAQDAQRLLASGKARQAVVRYQRAHFLARTNEDYALGYVQALLSAGDVERAESIVSEQLESNSNDGRANLLMARVTRAKGQAAEADSFYHRAIYGVWPNGAVADREHVRLELADWLAQRGAKDELLAELLPLQAAARDNPAMGRKVAELLLAAGSPVRAAEQYRALLVKNPGDVAAYRGLGEAELRRGNYSAAQRAFMNAVRHDGTDEESAKRLQTLGVIVSLDPTPRRLSLPEKCERSTRLLARVMDDLAACEPPPPATDDAPGAKGGVSKNAKGEISTNETAEMDVSRAEQLWRTRPPNCPSAQRDEPLKFVMDKITAQ